MVYSINTVLECQCYIGYWDCWCPLMAFRNQSLHKLLQEWKQAAMISREEYDQNLAQSQEHYHKNQLRHCFSHWHDLLLTERTVTAANHKLVRYVCWLWQLSLCSQIIWNENHIYFQCMKFFITLCQKKIRWDETVFIVFIAWVVYMLMVMFYSFLYNSGKFNLISSVL